MGFPRTVEQTKCSKKQVIVMSGGEGRHNKAEEIFEYLKK
jgi:hypothetical protein